ncbi:aminopeptidase [Candidatus Bathyarchaeota archaeon]|nr:aminopeptidase [Candidatus Bathyarchaeota archaeon]
MSTPRFVKSVVKTCLRIGKGDKVTIFAWRHMIDLAEAFALECEEAGAMALIEIETDELYYHKALNSPIEYLKESNPFSLALLEIATANIFISGPEDPERLKLISLDRYNAMVEAEKPYYDRLLEKTLRSAHIGLGYVTCQRARTYGLDFDEWKENIQAAMDVRYQEMQILGNRIARLLEKTDEVRIKTIGGTDLSLQLEGRTALVNDGVIDDEDIERGADFTALPAGQVVVVPKENSANGAYFSNVPEANAGLSIRDVVWKFKDGKLTSFKGGDNVECVRALWKKARGEKDQVGSLSFGLNPKAKTGFLYNPIVLGTATLSLGDNREVGGKIESSFAFHCTVEEPSVELDGKEIMRRGKLLLP